MVKIINANLRSYVMNILSKRFWRESSLTHIKFVKVKDNAPNTKHIVILVQKP